MGRTNIDNEQKQVLVYFFERGMTSVAQENMAQILKAAEETGLAVEVIKV